MRRILKIGRGHLTDPTPITVMPDKIPDEELFTEPVDLSHSAYVSTMSDEEAILGWFTTYADVLDRYEDPARHYHNRRHVIDVVRACRQIAGSLTSWQQDVLTHAAIFHDAIYDPERTDNEQLSADLARETICYDDIRDPVARLVEMTASHNRSDIQLVNIFMDADLSVLGSDPNTYAQYRENIRQEYAIYDDSQYATGRIRVLESLLSSGIYSTDYGQRMWESQATENMSAEIRYLQSFCEQE